MAWATGARPERTVTKLHRIPSKRVAVGGFLWGDVSRAHSSTAAPPARKVSRTRLRILLVDASPADIVLGDLHYFSTNPMNRDHDGNRLLSYRALFHNSADRAAQAYPGRGPLGTASFNR